MTEETKNLIEAAESIPVERRESIKKLLLAVVEYWDNENAPASAATLTEA